MSKAVTIAEMKKRALKVPKYVVREVLLVLRAKAAFCTIFTIFCHAANQRCKRCAMGIRGLTFWDCSLHRFRRQANARTIRKRGIQICEWRLKQKGGKS